MESGLRTVDDDDCFADCERYYSSDTFSDTSSDVDEQGLAFGEYGEMPGPAGRGVASWRDAADGGFPSQPEGPLTQLPSTLWHRVIPYLLMPEAMSLRCTSRLVRGHLKLLTDAIQDGCRIVDQITLRGNRGAVSPVEIMDKLLTLRWEARCGLLKRYTRQGGMARSGEYGPLDEGKSEPVLPLKTRYFNSREDGPRSRREASMRAWHWTVATTKSELLDATLDASGSIALSDLYAAEMFAPLLGLISDPAGHVRRVMKEAAGILSPLRWMDFLHAVGPIKPICIPVSRAYRALATSFDRQYPLPRCEVISAIVHGSMLISHPRSTRDMCLNQMGIPPDYLRDRITPCVTQSIVESMLSDPFLRGIDVPYRLQRLAQRWDDQDVGFAASLHKSFLTGLAQNAFCKWKPWPGLSETVRDAFCTRVLGLSPNDEMVSRLEAYQIIDFWGLYFEVTSPSTRRLLPCVALRMDALPWPLQATLWRLAADVHADPQRAWRGSAPIVFQELSVERVDGLCARALEVGMPRYALPALQASLRWQVTVVCMNRSQRGQANAYIRHAENLTRPDHSPVFTQAAWTIFERCSVAERLPFVAALFSYRDVLGLCGYDWLYESIIAEDVVSFLCDPTSALVSPSQDVMYLLLHHLPLCGGRLPEAVLGRDRWEAAFSRRFGLASEALTRPDGQA